MLIERIQRVNTKLATAAACMLSILPTAAHAITHSQASGTAGPEPIVLAGSAFLLFAVRFAVARVLSRRRRAVCMHRLITFQSSVVRTPC